MKVSQQPITIKEESSNRHQENSGFEFSAISKPKLI